MELSVIQWIVTQVGLAGIAALSIYITNKVWSERAQDQATRRAEEREDKLALLAAYKDNVTAMEKVASTLDHQSDTLDRLTSIIDKMQR